LEAYREQLKSMVIEWFRLSVVGCRLLS
jgi:hypothetical protein